MTPSSNPPTGSRILVVEDESLIAEEITDRLERMNYQVAGVADTAARAIEQAASSRPDLILMDIRLKGPMNGIDAAERIFTTLGIPSVFVTAHSDPDTIERARRSAQFGYVLKPFEEGALHSAIEMALQRYRVDRELKASQITQAAMIRCASDAIIATDLDGVILSWNPAAEALFGYNAEEAIGRNVGFLVLDGIEEQEAAILDQVRRGESLEMDATERRRKDGSLLDVWIKTSPVTNLQGRVVGAVKIVRDVSESKRAERKLRESQAQLLASQHIAHVGSWELTVSLTNPGDLDSAIVRWSEECFRIFGYAPGAAEIDNAMFWERVHPEDRQRVGGAMRHALESRSVYEIEHRIVLPDGSERVVYQRAEPVEDPGARPPIGLIGTTQDITERKRAEIAIRENEQRLRAIVEGMPVLLVAFDEIGVPVAWNRECERVTGYSAAEIVGNPRAVEILCPNATEGMFDDFHGWGGNARGQLWSVTCKDGTARRIEWSSISDQLPIAGWASWSVGVDLTRRLRLEEQLRQSQKMEGLGRLAGGVAHDFNNLLTVINGYSDLLLRKLPEGDRSRASVLQIRNAGGKAADLTRQLLTFGRHQAIEPRLLDLNLLIAEDLDFLKSTAGERVKVVTELGATLGQVIADAGQIHQVTMNLVLNARDAMPHGGRIAIRTANLDVDENAAVSHSEIGPGRFAVLSVSDTGEGIAPDIMDRIFDPFFTTKSGGTNAGLGLAIVYASVKQAGGSILVSSQPGIGTSFSVYLPRVDAPEPVASPRHPELPANQGRETILVVDDRADVRRLVASTLGDSGYAILEAESGEEALRKAGLHSGPIHLLLTDVIMPGMTGVELSGRMRNLRPETKTLFMSGYSVDLAAGGNLLGPDAACIAKPFKPNALAAKIGEVLGGRH